MRIPVVLPCNTAAATATFSCGRIIAADGFECALYSVPEGCCFNTRRPYSFVASGCEPCTLVAIGGGCGNRVYFLDSEFREIDAVTPRTHAGVLNSVYCCGCSGRLLLTYRSLIAIADSGGNITDTVRTTDDEEVDFISAFPLCNGYLLAYNDGQRDIIEKNTCGRRCRYVLPNCTRVKGFACGDDGNIYVFIGKGYPYTFLVSLTDEGTVDCNLFN